MAALSLSLPRSVTWWLVRAGEIFAGTQPWAALRNPACAASLCLSEEVHFVKMASGSWTPGAETEQCFMMSMTNNLIWFWGPVQWHCLISKSYRLSQKSSFLWINFWKRLSWNSSVVTKSVWYAPSRCRQGAQASVWRGEGNTLTHGPSTAVTCKSENSYGREPVPVSRTLPPVPSTLSPHLGTSSFTRHIPTQTLSSLLRYNHHHRESRFCLLTNDNFWTHTGMIVIILFVWSDFDTFVQFLLNLLTA